ncbi:GntR family transcriptional regulator [Litoreibacter albidus]|uniref:GntR family transcriptional regulator n=1 Tax=Litoreibacter albidus TaxID=670155 RepID=UPI0037361804
MSSARLDVYEGIRNLIMSGEIVAGDPMPEEMLAERLNTSRTPVRDALHQLETEGIVDRRPNRRVYLADVNPMTVVQIFEVRARLEPLAARLAASHVDHQFLKDLQGLIDKMTTVAQSTSTDRRLYRQFNEEFHWRILQQSNSSAVTTAVRQVARHRITSPTFQNWTLEELERSQNHHREILDAFMAEDGDWADAVMTTHLFAAKSIYTRATLAVDSKA